MTTYAAIKKQLAELEKQAAEARKAEVPKVIAHIKALMAEFDLTPVDLGFKAGDPIKRKVAGKLPRPAPAPKYKNPKTSETWSGLGKAPKWIAPSVKRGDAAKFLIVPVTPQPAAEVPAPVPAAKPAKKATAKRAARKPAVQKKAAKPAATKKKGLSVIRD